MRWRFIFAAVFDIRGKRVPVVLRDVGDVRKPILQVRNGPVRKLRRNHAEVPGDGLEQALDPFLQFNMERSRRRHDHHLAILQFISLAGFGAFG
jgi:hypothetical protein